MKTTHVLALLALVACKADTETDPADSDATCVPDGAFAILEAHLNHVDSVVGLLVGHPSAIEATSLVEVPGFEGPVSYATLIGPCTEALTYDEYCDPESQLCSQIECTGAGAGWIVHQRAATTLTRGDFEFESVTSATNWADGSDGFSWTAGSVASANGNDWSMAGSGDVVADGDSWTWTLTESLPALSTVDAMTLEVTHSPEGGSGTIDVGAVTVATIDAELNLVPTDACP